MDVYITMTMLTVDQNCRSLHVIVTRRVTIGQNNGSLYVTVTTLVKSVRTMIVYMLK